MPEPIIDFDFEDYHSCSANFRLDCDYSKMYYNWLACTCLASYQCEIFCNPGTTLDPFEVCGECLPDEKVRGIYPEWASDKDIAVYAAVGSANQESRPEDWRVCP